MSRSSLLEAPNGPREAFRWPAIDEVLFAGIGTVVGLEAKFLLKIEHDSTGGRREVYSPQTTEHPHYEAGAHSIASMPFRKLAHDIKAPIADAAPWAGYALIGAVAMSSLSLMVRSGHYRLQRHRERRFLERRLQQDLQLWETVAPD